MISASSLGHILYPLWSMPSFMYLVVNQWATQITGTNILVIQSLNQVLYTVMILGPQWQQEKASPMFKPFQVSPCLIGVSHMIRPKASVDQYCLSGYE